MKVIIHRGPVYSSMQCVDGGFTDINRAIAAVRHVCSAKPSGYQFMDKYKRGVWDGNISLLKGSNFPSGLIDSVVEALDVAGYEFDVYNETSCPNIYLDAIQPDMLVGLTLRPYQMEAARKLLYMGNGVAKMATNAGKTAVAAAIAKAIACNMLVFVTTKDLLYQTTVGMSKMLNERVGMIGDGRWERGRVTVCTIQTLSNHTGKLSDEKIGCVLFDECHHIPSRTAQEVMMGIVAPLRFGMSGTPLQYDDLNDLILVASTGPVRVEVTNQDLIQAGISAMPVVKMYDIDDPGQEWNYKAKYAAAYDEAIVNNSFRNLTIAGRVEHFKAKSTLVLVDRIQQGWLLQALMKGSIFVHGGSSMADRKAAVELLKAGTGQIVIATNIFGEGVDVPAVDVLVLAGGGLGHIKLLQRIGRGMRRKDSNTLIVVDFVDSMNKHLLYHSLERAKLYEAEGFIVEMV